MNIGVLMGVWMLEFVNLCVFVIVKCPFLLMKIDRPLRVVMTAVIETLELILNSSEAM